MNKIALALAVILIVTSPAYADKYVRDGATGSTCADWGANACDAASAAETLVTRGETIWVAGGTYAATTFNVTASGTTLISIKKATIAAHGTDTGWQDSYATGAMAFASVSFDTGYWDFSGVTGGGPGSWNSSHGCTFTAAAGASIDFVSFGQSTTETVNIRHCSFKETGNVDATGNNANGIKHVNIINNSTFEYNEFSNLSGLPFFFRYGDGNVIQYNWSGHVCGVFVFNGDHCEALVMWGMNDLTFRWNYVGESPSSGGIVKNDSDGHGRVDSANVRIYGNVFRNGAPIQMSGTTSVCTNWFIFQNTFVTGISASPVGGDCGTITTSYAYNNIVYGSSPSIPFNVTHDYTYYSTNSSPQCNMDFGAHENGTDLYPGNCDAMPNTVNPFVTGTPSTATTPEGLKLSGHIAAVSGLSSTGVDICTIQACTGDNHYNVDMFGVTFGADGTWDRGMAQFGSGGCTPAKLLYSSQPTSAVLGATLGTISVGVYDSGDVLCTDDNATTVTLSKTSGQCTGMTLNGTVSGTVASGVFTTNNVNMTVATGACTLDASDGGALTDAISASFSISSAGSFGGASRGRVHR